MQRSVLPDTASRVEASTAPQLNAAIRRQMHERIARFYGADRNAIDRRIAQLQREWDIERVLETNAASLMLVGVALGALVNRKWLLLPAAVSAFLLQHALQGWCPPLPVFRRRGVRTAREIHAEITALRDLRGDFGAPAALHVALRRAALQ